MGLRAFASIRWGEELALMDDWVETPLSEGKNMLGDEG